MKPYWIMVATVFLLGLLSVFVIRSLVDKVDELEEQLELMRGSHTEQILKLESAEREYHYRFDNCQPRLSMKEIMGFLTRPDF